MSLKGSTALIRLAQNPECEILGAMVMQEGSEKRFYERVLGQPYDREFGERQSSKRRGTQFEQNAYAGDARLLREVLAPFVGLPPEDMRVHNLLDHYPGTKDDARIARLRMTRQLLAGSVAGGIGPRILIQVHIAKNLASSVAEITTASGNPLPAPLSHYARRQTGFLKMRDQFGRDRIRLRPCAESVDSRPVAQERRDTSFDRLNGAVDVLKPRLVRAQAIRSGKD
jgi:hypothetical protein